MDQDVVVLFMCQLCVPAAYPDSMNGGSTYPIGYPPPVPSGVHSTTEPLHHPVAHAVPHSTHTDANNHLPKPESSEVH